MISPHHFHPTNGVRSSDSILVSSLALAAAVGVMALIGGCQFVVMDAPAALTAWLDYQEVPGDVAELYAHDFTGKTKGEVLVEYAALEGKNAVAGRDWVSVESPTQVWISIELPEPYVREANALAKEKLVTWKYVPLGHGEKCPRLDSWQDGLGVPIDIGNPCVLLNTRYSDLGTKPKSDNNLPAWYAFCLDKSCCWALFHRKYDGETYQAWGYRRYCMLVIEFDDNGTVKRQYPVHYGVGDG